MERWRLVMVLLVALCLAGSASLSYALWSDSGRLGEATLGKGGVVFAVQTCNGHSLASQTVTNSVTNSGQLCDPTTRQYAQAATARGTAARVNPARGATVGAGTPLRLTVPGEVIASALDSQGAVVYWRFEVLGQLLGSLTLVYDVSFYLPDAATNTPGRAVLAGSSFQVYPAGDGGDCSDRPDLVQPDDNGLMTVSDQILHDGTSAVSGLLSQVWCAAIQWQADPPRWHTNVATASWTTPSGKVDEASDSFTAVITYPSRLSPTGSRTDLVKADGWDTNQVIVRAASVWSALIYPRASAEIGLDLTVQPRIIQGATG